MPEFLNNILANIAFIFQRLNWLSVLDLFLVTMVFFIVLLLMRGTQAMVLLRGALLLFVLIFLLASLEVLPAFSWMVTVTLPAILLAIPVIFAPEIRHALERLGRAGSILPTERSSIQMRDTISSISHASGRLSARKHGALIILQRRDPLEDYVKTGVFMDANVSAELLLQVFYPNTPLHDGAVIISGSKIIAAACVLPLSSSGVLNSIADRQMGLRHRAALGISEVSDAIAVVVSEETGSISVVHAGRMIRRLDAERLENILRAFFRPAQQRGLFASFSKLFQTRSEKGEEE